MVLASAGGGLLLGCRVDRARDVKGASAAATPDPAAFAPDAFVRIDRDGRVTVIVPQVEMGQGIYTSMPMLVAEELEVDLDQVQVEHAPPNDKLYANPLIGFQVTGGSTSVRAMYQPLRNAGATARTMLIAAAAQQWTVDPATCRARRARSAIRRPAAPSPTGHLADAAARVPVPAKVALKDAKDFTLIGTPAKRLDSAGKGEWNGEVQH